MANQEGTVIGYPVQTFSSTTTTTTSTATTTNSTNRRITTQNRRNTNISTHTCRHYCVAASSAVFGVMLFAFCIAIPITSLYAAIDTPGVQVDSVTVYSFNISSSHITANWDFNFTIKNYYGEPFSYRDIWASVFYKETNISSTTIGSFLQGQYHRKRSVQATIAVNNSSVASANNIVEDWSHGAVNFTFTVNAIAKIDRKPRHIQKQMTVSCEDVTVYFLLNTPTIGTMLGGSRECSVSLHKLRK